MQVYFGISLRWLFSTLIVLNLFCRVSPYVNVNHTAFFSIMVAVIIDLQRHCMYIRPKFILRISWRFANRCIAFVEELAKCRERMQYIASQSANNDDSAAALVTLDPFKKYHLPHICWALLRRWKRERKRKGHCEAVCEETSFFNALFQQRRDAWAGD